uniref:Bacteriophage/plasmid primase P4 C-terminal domain-containing protein n=1 Tax=Glaukea argentea TaxID=2894057 RepID=A0A386B1I5_9CHLO|nr:hypothetical protein [Udotea argentea]AYC65565.1 hypothetical protein [Udotea argentea]
MLFVVQCLHDRGVLLSATLKILSNWSIPSTWIKRIFADTDILTNPQVFQGYKELTKACPDSVQVLVYPPKNFITDDGYINFEKYSPDDWIEEKDDIEIILRKVKEIKIESIEKYHQNFRVVEKSEIQLKRGKPNEEVIQWLCDYFQGRLLYISETSQFFYYQQKGYWGVFNSKTLLDRVLSDVETNQWSYQILENALKLVAPKFFRDAEEVMQLFLNRRYIGFQNGVWDFETGKLLEHDPQLYISGLLPFNYVSASQPPFKPSAPGFVLGL